MVWWNIYILSFGSALVLALVLTPFFRQVAICLNILDHPVVQDHKKHKAATPLLGGIAICLAWLATIVAGIIASRTSFFDQHLDRAVLTGLPGITHVSSELVFLCVGAILITAFGLYDDLYNMPAVTKFAGQLVVAVIAVTWGGVKISIFIDNPVLVWCVSVFWMLLVINAMNFFDNMDGLAIGTGAIAFSLFAISAAINMQHFVAVFGAAMAGAAFGFWFFNFPPASIFMGDSGSHLVGYNMAVLGSLVTYYNGVESQNPLSILIPLFILAIPLFDLFAVVVIRLKLGKPFYIGDHNHISHRFVKMGLSRKNSVFAVHLLVLSVGMSVLPLLWGGGATTAICLLQVLTILILVSLIQYGVLAEKDDAGKT